MTGPGQARAGGVDGHTIRGTHTTSITLEPVNPGDTTAHLRLHDGTHPAGGITVDADALEELIDELIDRAAVLRGAP